MSACSTVSCPWLCPLSTVHWAWLHLHCLLTSIIIFILPLARDNKSAFLLSSPARIQSFERYSWNSLHLPAHPGPFFSSPSAGSQERSQTKRAFLSDADLFLLTIPTERGREFVGGAEGKHWKNNRGRAGSHSIGSGEMTHRGNLWTRDSFVHSVFTWHGEKH